MKPIRAPVEYHTAMVTTCRQRKRDENCMQHATQLTPVFENYLEIIFHEELRNGAARASSIASAAGVSRSTVTSALRTLSQHGLIEYEPYSLIHLTPAGRSIGQDIALRHIIFQEFFQQILQVEPGQANAVACELEHVVPPEIIRRLGQFVLYLLSRKQRWENWQEEYIHVRDEYVGALRRRAASADHDDLSCRIEEEELLTSKYR